MGANGIDVHNLGTAATTRFSGAITIQRIGTGGVNVQGDLLSYVPGGNYNYLKPVTIADVDGPVTVGHIKTYTDGGASWSQKHAGNVNITAVGDVHTGDIVTYFRASSTGYDAGSVNITSSTGFVQVGALDTQNYVNNTGSDAGDVTITAYRDLRITGSVNLGAASGGTRRGDLILSTGGGGGGAIHLGNDPTDTFDLSSVNFAKLDSDSNVDDITGVLANFNTASSGGSGSYYDPLITTQTVFRAPADERIFYDYVPGGLNDYLGGKAYRITDLSGVAGQGGLLLFEVPVPEPAGLGLALLGLAGLAARRRT